MVLAAVLLRARWRSCRSAIAAARLRAGALRRLWREPRRLAGAAIVIALPRCSSPRRVGRRHACRSACRGSARISASTRSSAFFLAVVNLGAAAASLFALGYGRHEHAPQRVLPFYPAFLAGMNLVVLADDAFTLPGRRGSSCRCRRGRW